jgi:PAS domain S-box-containing protein
MINLDAYRWTEDQLGESEALLARVVEISADALLVITLDGWIAFLNAAAERLLGIPRDKLTGRPYTDPALKLFTVGGQPLPVEDRPATRVMRTGEPVYDLDVLFERPDGERVVLSANASPLLGADAEMTGVVIALRDVTARTEADDALRQQAAMLLAQAELLELAHDAIFVRDRVTGIILYWNRGAEEVYGYRREDAVGRVPHELLHTQFPMLRREIEEVLVRDGQWEGELVQRRRDGREVVIDSRWALQRDARGEPVAFLEINRDITARKAAEEEVARRHRELAAINTSLASIVRALEPAEILQTIVDAARELVHAQYAALGVTDSHGHITEFITSGISAEQRAAIGPLPQGHGLLGVLIRDAQPLRVPVIADDPRSQGFPPNHPSMTSFLGVPMLSRGRAVGDAYLTDKIDAEAFSDDDERAVTILADHAAVAIENAHLYDDARAARDQLRAWNRNLEAQVAERTRAIEELSRELTARVLAAQEEERGRIARELHDDTAQALVRLLLDVDQARPYLPEEGPGKGRHHAPGTGIVPHARRGPRPLTRSTTRHPGGLWAGGRDRGIC